MVQYTAFGMFERKEGRSKQMGERQYLFDVGSGCGVYIIPYVSVHLNILILLICLLKELKKENLLLLLR